ncbi:MAG: prepilin peptidase [Lachnospiraceae bacterium]
MIFITIIFMCVLIMAALQDIVRMEIKDGCHIAIVVLSLVSMFVDNQLTVFARLIGALCISAPMLFITLLLPGAFGGGDIKLIAAGGLFLGWRVVVTSAVISIFLGGVYSLYLLIVKHADRKTCFAFGPFLCVGMAIGKIFF